MEDQLQLAILTQWNLHVQRQDSSENQLLWRGQQRAGDGCGQVQICSDIDDETPLCFSAPRLISLLVLL